MTVKAGVLLAITFATGAASMAATRSLPVALVGKKSPPEFSFGTPGRKEAPRILQILVAAYERREVACVLKSKNASDGVRIARWRFGEEVPGCSMTACNALIPGKYLIDVVGDGVGSLKFEVRADGTVVETK